jgi:O-antigen/teichoic acid export membrane protein
VGTFSARILGFLLVPLYTYALAPDEFGTAGLIVDTCNLILPVMYVCIADAIIRFGLDRSVRKSDVFTTAFLAIIIGFAVFLACMPLILKVELISNYTMLVYFYVFASSMRTLMTFFIRSLGHVRLFAFDGILTTVTTAGFNILFLITLNMGVEGRVLATVAADGLSALCLFFFCRLHRFIRFKNFDRGVARDMLRYSIPLVPAAIMWWVTNLSDRYFISYMVGLDATGIYNVSYLIPTMIVYVSAIFINAWQISAFTESGNKRAARRFFSTVFKSYYTFIFLAAAGLMLLAKPLVSLLTTRPEYFEAWRYVPILLIAVAFSCFVSFYGTIYNMAKRNAMVTVTTAVGAGGNIALNFLLIPVWGAQGAAVATFTSFFVVFLIRAVDTRRYLKIDIQPTRFVLNLALLGLQAWIMLAEPLYALPLQCGVFALMLLCNARFMLFILRKLMGILYRRRKVKRLA